MFSPDTYYRLFELVNAELWPAQILTLAAGVAILLLIIRSPAWAGRAVAALLAASWALVAWAYFFERYATINLAAPYAGWAFAAQSLIFFLIGVLAGRLSFDHKPKPPLAKTGVALAVFALAFQPLIGPALGRAWSGIELFGIAPDPTVLATLGVLLAADRMRWELIVIPLLWCAATGATLWTMGAPEAAVMPAAGLLVLLASAYRALSSLRKLTPTEASPMFPALAPVAEW